MGLIMHLLFATALATSGFDPGGPAATFDAANQPELLGNHTGTKVLWERIDRFDDVSDAGLFPQHQFNSVSRWADSEFTPHIATLFADSEPGSESFLLHAAIGTANATGVPILLVHGAGDNASRAWSVLRDELIALDRPVYAITFAHPHGDVFSQAEVLADAIAVITARTGEQAVDLVAHSKGGMAVATYTSHTPTAVWGSTPTAQAYEDRGTPYRNDVRRVVYVGSPLGGLDTSYRWTGGNFIGLDADLAISPTSWSTYYPYGSSYWWLGQDLEEQDFLSTDGDLFPGQRQLLQRQPAPLPGTLPWLGGYALQQDWYTTYEGGFGLYSWSDGIDDAIADGGFFMDHLAAQGMDPRIDVFVLAGGNPMMPNGDEAFRQLWDGIASASAWDLLLTSADTFVTSMTWDDGETQGLAEGYLVLGEISGPSDGLLFVDSALATSTLDARGVSIVETRVADVSHTELLIASDGMGAVMMALAGDAAENRWMISRGQRYLDEDTTGWIAAKLSDAGGSSQGRGSTAPAVPAPSVNSTAHDMGCVTSGADSTLGSFGALISRRR